jgi:hypothetical protein
MPTRLLLAATLMIALLLAPVGSAAAHASPTATGTVPVVRCHTTFGIENGWSQFRVPRRLRVGGHPSSLAGLSGYTNGISILLAPSGMTCSGTVGTDLTAELTVYPRGDHRPTAHSATPALDLDYFPDCTSCEAGLACPFFPSWANRTAGFTVCTTHVPEGEKVVRPNSRLALFTDPPGVRGDGYPSGGLNSAYGLVSLSDPRGDPRVVRATCSLPASEARVCTRSLDDVLARYG